MGNKTNSLDQNYGILTKEEIKNKELIKVEDDNSNCYQSASYDFRIGSQYYIPQTNNIENNIVKKIKDLKNKLFSNDNNCSNIKELKENDVLTIPKYTAVIISTKEKMNLPYNIAGRFDLKIRWALSGLIFQCGTQIEPGYKGKLFGVLFNVTDKEKIVNQNDRILTGEFYYLNKIVSNGDEDERNKIVEFMSNDIISGSINSMYTTVKQLKEEAGKFSRARTSIFIILITFALSVTIPYILSTLTYDKGEIPVSSRMQLRDYYRTSSEGYKTLLKRKFELLNMRDSLKNNGADDKRIKEINKRINSVEKLLEDL